MIDYSDYEAYNIPMRGRNRDARIDRNRQRLIWYKLNEKKAKEEASK